MLSQGAGRFDCSRTAQNHGTLIGGNPFEDKPTDYQWKNHQFGCAVCNQVANQAQFPARLAQEYYSLQKDCAKSFR